MSPLSAVELSAPGSPATRPCAVCGVSKRHIFNQVALQQGYTALATGHNLDDEAAVLLSNTLTWSSEQLARQSPVLPARPGLARKVKPFCRFYERETAAYALMQGIDYVYDECPHAAGNQTNYYKTQLNQMEAERPGTKLTFYLGFLQVKEKGWPSAPEANESSEELHPCPNCGQPTTLRDLCAFCKQIKPAD